MKKFFFILVVHKKYIEINFCSFSLEITLRIVSGIFLLK